jgi:hypothetical protein
LPERVLEGLGREVVFEEATLLAAVRLVVLENLASLGVRVREGSELFAGTVYAVILGFEAVKGLIWLGLGIQVSGL